MPVFQHSLVLNFLVCMVAVNLLLKNFILKGDLPSVSMLFDLEDGIQNMYVFLFTSQTTWSDTISCDHLGLLIEMDKKKSINGNFQNADQLTHDYNRSMNLLSI